MRERMMPEPEYLCASCGSLAKKVGYDTWVCACCWNGCVVCYCPIFAYPVPGDYVAAGVRENRGERLHGKVRDIYLPRLLADGSEARASYEQVGIEIVREKVDHFAVRLPEGWNLIRQGRIYYHIVDEADRKRAYLIRQNEQDLRLALTWVEGSNHVDV